MQSAPLGLLVWLLVAVAPRAQSDSLFVRYEDPEHRFRIDYPAAWETPTREGTDFAARYVDRDQASFAVLTVDVRPTDRSELSSESFYGDLDDPETLALFVDLIGSRFRGLDVEYVSHSPARVAGRFAIQVEALVTPPESKVHLLGFRQLHFVLYNTESADRTLKVFVGCMSPDKGDLMNLCDEAARTFAFAAPRTRRSRR